MIIKEANVWDKPITIRFSIKNMYPVYNVLWIEIFASAIYSRTDHIYNVYSQI